MNDEIISDIKITNRLEGRDWANIEVAARDNYLQFLRHRVEFRTNYDNVNENGNPKFWAVLEWLEENTTDLWYTEDDCLFFYSDEDLMAFKLRWS